MRIARISQYMRSNWESPVTAKVRAMRVRSSEDCLSSSASSMEAYRRFVVRVSSRWPKNRSTANTDRSATSAPAVMKKSRFSARIDMRC